MNKRGQIKRKRSIFDFEDDDLVMSQSLLSPIEEEGMPNKYIIAETPPKEVIMGEMSIKLHDDNKLVIEDGLDKVKLPAHAYSKLLQNREKIERAFDAIADKKFVDVSIHLGQQFYVNLQNPYWVVHITQWVKKDGKRVKEQSVSLPTRKWRNLRQFLRQMDVLELHRFEPCCKR